MTIGAATTTADPVAIIAAVSALITAACTSVAGLIVAIRTDRTAAQVRTKVDAVHDCLHEQAAGVKEVIANQATVKAALESES